MDRNYILYGDVLIKHACEVIEELRKMVYALEAENEYLRSRISHTHNNVQPDVYQI